MTLNRYTSILGNMPRASKKPVDKSLDQELREHYVDLISFLQKSSEVEGFFNQFLTKEEKVMLGKRLMLHLMLEKGYKPEQISPSLSISQETVRIHKFVWQNGSGVYKEILRKIAQKDKTKEFWRKIEEKLKPLDLAMRARHDMRARAKLASGDWS